MDDLSKDIITLDLSVKSKHFYYLRTVQIGKGVFKYFEQDSPTKFLFQANLSDIILLDKIEDKPEILLSSKSNSFSLLKLSHEQSSVLFSFKTQLERMIEIENAKIKEEEENAKTNAKSKQLNEIIVKYSLIPITLLPTEIEALISSKFKPYKCFSNIQIDTSNKAKTVHLDQTLFLYDNISLIKNFKRTLLQPKGSNQLFLCKFMSVIISVLSLVYVGTNRSLYQMITILTVVLPFINKIYSFLMSRVRGANEHWPDKSFNKEFTLKSSAYLNMNMFHVFEYIIIECHKTIVRNKTKVLSNESFLLYSDIKHNLIVLIESAKDLSQALSVYVLQSDSRFNQTQVCLYSLLSDEYPIDYQKEAFWKLGLMIGKIHLRLEEGFFNPSEAFLHNDDPGLSMDNSMELHDDMKLEVISDIDKGKTSSFSHVMMIDYEKVIQMSFKEETNLLKDEIAITTDKDIVMQFAFNCSNLALVNDSLKKAELLLKEQVTLWEFGFHSIGDINVKARYEYGVVEVNGIEYTVIGYKNDNELSKLIDHFGFYLWRSNDYTRLCSWIRYDSSLIDDPNDKVAVLKDMQLYVEGYRKFEDILSSKL